MTFTQHTYDYALHRATSTCSQTRPQATVFVHASASGDSLGTRRVLIHTRDQLPLDIGVPTGVEERDDLSDCSFLDAPMGGAATLNSGNRDNCPYATTGGGRSTHWYGTSPKPVPVMYQGSSDVR